MASDDRFAGVRQRGGEKYAAWLAAGYRECYSAMGKSTPFLLQKRFRDASGVTTHFVNVWAYDWSEYRDWHGDDVTYMASCQFNTSGDQQTFNVELLHLEDPESTEQFFDRVYRLMECRPRGDD